MLAKTYENATNFSGQKTLFDNTIELNEQIPRGHPELVNFPSTAEVFHAVFENSLYANCIGNGSCLKEYLMKKSGLKWRG